MRFIIIGSGGQDGRILTKQLTEKGHYVQGISRQVSNNEGTNIADKTKLKEKILTFKPDIIINLAAKASTDDKYIPQNYDAMIKGLQNLREISHLNHKFHLINFGSIYQFDASKDPIDLIQSKRNYNNHYSIFRNIQEYYLKDNQHDFLSVQHFYMCHHESRHTQANNFTIKLIHHLQSILKGSTSEKLLINSPSSIREWSDATIIMEKMISKLENDLTPGFSAKIFNNREGASTYNFIKSFCDYNHLQVDNFFEFKRDFKLFQTDNEDFEYSEIKQNWIKSFN
jgi:GDP-D-mannose dehydratase